MKASVVGETRLYEAENPGYKAEVSRMGWSLTEESSRVEDASCSP